MPERISIALRREGDTKIMKEQSQENKPALVICAVGARDELAIGVVAREPTLQIKFANGSVIECP
jgi:hypothetical protein